MIVYVIERGNPEYRPEPEVMTSGENALRTVREEYEEAMEMLGITQEEADAGFGSYGAYWTFDGCIGSASIVSDYDCDCWEWRVTAHEIR